MRSGFGLERTRAVTAENPDGEVGAGGQAESDLGPGRKGRPCITISAGETVELFDAEGPGARWRCRWATSSAVGTASAPASGACRSSSPPTAA